MNRLSTSLLILAFASPTLGLAAEGPKMISIPAGHFMMGDEAGDPDEKPVHRVAIKSFLLATTEVTVGEYRAFVTATGHATTKGCNRYVDGKLTLDPDLSWDNPGFAQTDRHPVVCITWPDTQAYIAWRNASGGAKFRLPTEAEWEYAARAGASATTLWAQSKDACVQANAMDASTMAAGGGRFALGDPNQYKPGDERVFPCDDGHGFTAPVGAFKPNAWGLYDMLGNAWEFVADCVTKDYTGAPTDGGVVSTPECRQHMMRGASWNTGPAFTRLTNRSTLADDRRNWGIGFRLAQDVN
ncbi:MAG: formylglycine-generating enzyme family protein [Rhodospirillaceae bacterium]|nr:formylglycine-generating enzyme family protein [Rhodospirillaceae bacterium]